MNSDRVSRMIAYLKVNGLFDLDVQDLRSLWENFLPPHLDPSRPRDDDEREVVDLADSQVAASLAGRYGFDDKLSHDETEEFLAELMRLAEANQGTEMARSVFKEE